MFLAAVYTFKWGKTHVINLSIEKILLRYPPVFLSPDARLRMVRYRPGCFPGRISYWSSEPSASLGEVRFCCVPAALFWRKASYLSHRTGKQRQQSMQTTVQQTLASKSTVTGKRTFYFLLLFQATFQIDCRARSKKKINYQPLRKVIKENRSSNLMIFVLSNIIRCNWSELRKIRGNLNK